MAAADGCTWTVAAVGCCLVLSCHRHGSWVAHSAAASQCVCDARRCCLFCLGLAEQCGTCVEPANR